MMRRLLVCGAVLGLLAAGCGDDVEGGAGEVAESTTSMSTEEVPEADSDSAPPAASAEPDDTTVPDDGPDEGVEGDAIEHDSARLGLEFCEAFRDGRDSATVVSLMSEDAIVVDHTVGARYEGREGIGAWIDENPGFATFELAECADNGVATNWWSAATYMLHSAVNEGGTEGIAAVRVHEGEIAEFHPVYTVVPTQPVPAGAVSPSQRETIMAWCEAWGTEDADQVLPLATADVALGGIQTGVPGVGEDKVRQMAFMLQEDPEDTVECGGEIIANGGWTAMAMRFVDTDNADGDWGGSWGGVLIVQIEDGLVSRQIHLMDAMDPDGNYVDVVQLPTGEVIVNPDEPANG